MKTTSNKSLHQFARYVLVGGVNTVFGYGLFALLNWLFTGLVSYSYMYAAALANIVAITEPRKILRNETCTRNTS